MSQSSVWLLAAADWVRDRALLFHCCDPHVAGAFACACVRGAAGRALAVARRPTEGRSRRGDRAGLLTRCTSIFIRIANSSPSAPVLLAIAIALAWAGLSSGCTAGCLPWTEGGRGPSAGPSRSCCTSAGGSPDQLVAWWRASPRAGSRGKGMPQRMGHRPSCEAHVPRFAVGAASKLPQRQTSPAVHATCQLLVSRACRLLRIPVHARAATNAWGTIVQHKHACRYHTCRNVHACAQCAEASVIHPRDTGACPSAPEPPHRALWEQQGKLRRRWLILMPMPRLPKHTSVEPGC